MTRVTNVVREKDLSEHTRPGRLGFKYAVEINLKYGIFASDYTSRYSRYKDLYNECQRNLGKPYQPHWTRKQLNRKWYVQRLGNRVIRFCFKSKLQRAKAMLLY